MSLLKVAGTTASSGQLYSNDVFSTYLYTGNSSTQTINNGIDLAGKGGLVWIKRRTDEAHYLFDTNRGALVEIPTQGDEPSETKANSLTSFNSDGFSLGSWGGTNYSVAPYNTYASWTFRKAAKFFDVVTYTGTGSARTIAHSLGVAPGMVIVKRTDTTGDWQVYHRGLTSAANSIQLNLTAAQASAPTVWNSTAPTSSVFSVGTDATVNASGGTYVAYLYAHDTSSTGIIQCGSFTDNGAGTAINLGWEPQYILTKGTAASNWTIRDTMRGMSYSENAQLYPNLSSAEATGGGVIIPTATGFSLTNYVEGPGATVIYMAIRMPNKPPTSGTQVFSPFVGSDASTITTGFPVDMLFDNKRAGNSNNTVNASRLVGEYSLVTSSTAAETAGLVVANCFQNNTGYLPNALGTGIVSYAFKRAPGFFDEVCYTGTGVATTQAHNLTVVPELMIVKQRSAAGNSWVVYSSAVGNTKYMMLNSTIGAFTDDAWNNTTPTSSLFTISGLNSVNQSATTFVAYLFATLAGISKVGSYTGNGTTQNIDCGFAAGARFFLVKATSTTGSWWVWDSARGITAGNDPALQLNSTAAEITTADAVDPYSPGITVNQEATCSINASGVSYIFLAVA